MYIESLSAGGKERRLVELLKGLCKNDKLSCELVVMSDNIHYEKVLQLPLKIHKLIRSRRFDFSIFHKFNRICQAFNPDVVHSWGAMPSVYALPAVMLNGCKFVNGMVTIVPSEFKYNVCATLTFPFSDHIVSNSYIALELLKAPKRRSSCIPNGFDFSRIENLQDPKNIRMKLGIKTKKVVGMVAGFEDRKDYDTYLSAAKKILQTRDDVTFLCIGEGKNRIRYESQIDSSLQPFIKFTGKQNDVESIINILDVAVLSSLYEGLPNVVMEYMALGKPVVCTDAGGTSELIVDGKTGYITDLRDAERMKLYISSLLNDPDTAHAMGEVGRLRVEKHFNIDTMINSYVNLYRQLLRSNGWFNCSQKVSVVDETIAVNPERASS
jgi:glycosyltransferase involved in cell wall biosynthesis